LPALEHHTYSEDKKKNNFFHENGNFFRAEVGKKVKNKKIKSDFYSKSSLLDVRGFVKQGIKKYSPYLPSFDPESGSVQEQVNQSHQERYWFLFLGN
jgi:hypothetical protein